jgi:hypothetical protein
MARAIEQKAKRPYAKPKLTVFGTVRELTKRVGPRGKADRTGGNPIRNKTSL